MKYSAFTILLLFSVSDSFCQDYFFKRIDFDINSNDPSPIIIYKDRLYCTVTHFCGALECCSIVEFDAYGDTINRVVVPDIDPGFEPMIIDNDTITITGNNDGINTHFRMAHFDLDGNKLGSTIEILHPTQKFENSFQMTTQKIGGLFYVMGSGNDENYDYSLLYRVDKSGKLDTLLKMAQAGRRSTVWDSDIDKDGNLVTFHALEEPFGARDWIEVIKYNRTLDTIWKYVSEDDMNHLGFIRGSSIDNDLIFSTYTDGANHAKHSLRKVDNDKNESIIYEPLKLSSIQRAFVKIKILNNGDILGMGAFQDLSYQPPVHSAPWMIRMRPDGDIIWQRVFFELDPSDNESRFGLIEDVVELDNGDLFGVGSMRYEIPTSIVFKIDQNGCLDPDNCETLQFLTDTKNFSEEVDFNVYPNPTTQFVNIEVEYTKGLSYIMFNEMGQKVKEDTIRSNVTKVDISNLDSGIYFTLVIKNQAVVGNRKFHIN